MRLILSSDESRFLETSADLVQLSQSEKLENAFRKFGLFFLLAVCAVFIPVVHFFLVPILLLVAFVMAFRSHSLKYRLDLGEAHRCIDCQNAFEASYFLNEELRIKCEHCSSHYVVKTSTTRIPGP